jgi:hypothetical protein
LSGAKEANMRRSGLRVVTIAMLAAALFSAPARADQIALTGGFVDMEVNAGGAALGLIQLTGERGFTFFGHMAAGFTEPVGNPLPPGDTVTLRGSANGLDVGGTVTLDGVTYTGIGGLDAVAGASVLFVTTATLPSVLNAPSSVLAPFTLNVVFFPSSQTSHTLSGSGVARISLGEDKGFGVPSWMVTGIRAELSSAPAPVPEPATLLLAASGLGWVAARRRKAGHHRPSRQSATQ